jgi:signal transduction histidine kinase
VKSLRRLRWQLTLSHLLATAFTLLSMIAAVVLIASSVLGSQSNDSRQPASDARNVAGVIGGLVENNAPPADLDAVLHGLATGELRMTVGVADPTRRVPFQFGLTDLAYIVVLDPAGNVLASSEPDGGGFSPPERAQWFTLAANPPANGVTAAGPPGGPAALGAAPILAEGGARVGTVVVATNQLPTPGPRFDLLRGLALFGFASIVVLAAASIFALISSSVVAILLSRRVVRRLERLGTAAESLARGDLSSRVDAVADDELGQLAGRFNRMADDLEHTMSQLRAERDRVAGLLDERRQLVANASHELRTPVATVRGYLDAAIARPESVPDDLRSDLEIMERELSRLQQLIEDLFALSRAAVGRLTLRQEPVDPGVVVRRVVDVVGPLAWRQRRVQVIADVAPDAAWVLADQQRLDQIVSNLIGNAIRHTPPGGLVAAAISAESGLVRLDVRDTGEGIQPEDLPHVFEPFFRGRSTYGEGGAGLGLALVKDLAEAMGGSVSVESTAGEGSCFTVRLPAAPVA